MVTNAPAINVWSVVTYAPTINVWSRYLKLINAIESLEHSV